MRKLLLILLFIPCLSFGQVVLSWGLDGNLNDNSGNSYTGTGTSITYVQGEHGQGASFNGSSSKITVNTASPLQSTSFTYLCWVNVPDHTGIYDIWSFTSANGPGFRIQQTTGYLAFVKQGTEDILVGTVEVPLNQWVQVALTYDGTTANLYINGVNCGTTSKARTFSYSNLTIGGPYVGGGERFKGSMDIFKRYNVVLTPAQIKNDYGVYTGKSFY